MSDPRIRKALKTIGFWSNHTNDAYAMGEADWAFDNGENYLTAVASAYIEVDDWEGAAKAVELIAKERGIDPKRHRYHAR